MHVTGKGEWKRHVDKMRLRIDSNDSSTNNKQQSTNVTPAMQSAIENNNYYQKNNSYYPKLVSGHTNNHMRLVEIVFGQW